MNTLKETLKRILEIAIITDNIRAAENAGEITHEQVQELIDAVLTT